MAEGMDTALKNQAAGPARTLCSNCSGLAPARRGVFLALCDRCRPIIEIYRDLFKPRYTSPGPYP
jgi:hypothetical protein